MSFGTRLLDSCEGTVPVPEPAEIEEPAMTHRPTPNTPPTVRDRALSRFHRQRALANRHGAVRTADIDRGHVANLDRYLAATGDGRAFAEIDRDTLEEFLDAFARGKEPFSREVSDSYVNQCYRSLCNFYRWVTDEYELQRNPMARVTPRAAGEYRTEGKVLTEDELTRVLDVVQYNRTDFAAIRDHAMLRLLLVGMRRGELVGLTLDDVDLDRRDSTVRGKADRAGQRVRVIPFGDKTALALDRYLEQRDRHPMHARPELWLGHRGVITGRGLHHIVKKRGEQAGIEGLHPHKFRHTFADQWLAAGGNEGDLMELAGWKSTAMPRHYARETANKRARAAARRIGLDDRI